MTSSGTGRSLGGDHMPSAPAQWKGCSRYGGDIGLLEAERALG